MRRRTIMRPDSSPTGRARTRWWLPVASVGGTLFGIVASMYSAELRAALEASGRSLVTSGLPVAVTAVVASASGVLIYEFAFRRPYETGVTKGEIEIRADALTGNIHEEDAVVGRSLRYLETRRRTGDLVVCLHGLGLDANDFRPYMSESGRHCVALTLYGFNPGERDDENYQPISLESHVQLVGYALRRLQQAHPRKWITLVGFSFGADMIVFLPAFAEQVLGELRLRKVVLLDPNVNNTTTTISSKVASVDSKNPLRDLVGIMRSAKTPSEFRYLCEYLNKITSKNFAQVRRHAQEVVERYSHRSFGPFLDAVGQLTTSSTDGAQVVFSLNHEMVFNAVARAAVTRGLDVNSMECSRTHHFDLLSPGFLTDRIEPLL